jgi:hypothetical protein
MHLTNYGPFATLVTVAAALVATFSVFVLKAVGKVKRWSALTAGSPPFLVKTAARGLSVALIALTYVLIDASNYLWFGGAAIICGVLLFVAVVRFERLRQRHVVQVPLVAADGTPRRDWLRRPQVQNVVVGAEADLRPEAKQALADARAKRGGLSVRQFMSGYGAQTVNDPEALWDGTMLANIRSSLTTTLMCIILLGVLVLFWAAVIIEVAQTQASGG